MKHMHRLIVVAFVSALFSSALPAQLAGTWKLNVEKSQFGSSQPPKSETRTVETVGAGFKVSWNGVAADGTAIDFTMTTKLDGKPAPMAGQGMPAGAATSLVKRINANTETADVFSKDGKKLWTTRTTVSKDGKTTIQTRTGTDAKGNAVNQHLVWEKQ